MLKSVCALLLFACALFAQTTGTATVVGTVTDNTGAVVPAATINIVNTETQFVYNGEYLPGNQWVSPEHPYYQKKFAVPKRDVAKATLLYLDQLHGKRSERMAIEKAEQIAYRIMGDMVDRMAEDRRADLSRRGMGRQNVG